MRQASDLESADMLRLEVVPTHVAQLDGKILPNAHAIGDVDCDDATELIFGSITGTIAMFKVEADRLVKWRWCSVDGSVTAICVDVSANDARIFVATAEGSCFVFQFTESGDEFRPSSEFRVSLNVCDLAVLDGDLVVGTRDGGLYTYRADANALGGYKQLEKFEIKREIESFQLLNAAAESSSSSQLLVRCTSGEWFHITTLSEQQKKRTVQVWKRPAQEEDVAYIVDGIQTPSGESQIALASIAGKITVLSAAHEKQWTLKLPVAVVAIDKLSLANPSTKTHNDVLVACTWSGRVYVMHDSNAVLHFRMLYPASFMFCADIYKNLEKSERFLVGISTSGVIFVFRDLERTLAQAMTKLDTIRQSELFLQVDTDEKRREIFTRLTQKQTKDGSSLLAAELLADKPNPTIEDIVQFAVASTPAPLGLS
uniref:RSE1/DDB1/CPSF1 C-terminal domain-containing protein n=1 Tax=Globisporangium ultimum (strain ATCC 200006 / CBS 805.95 / DAOM BR144) TaxID=431595 RepID=K3WDN5_GLOUD